MKNKFPHFSKKTLLQLNIASIIIIAFCEVFALSIFLTKGLKEGIEQWRFIIMIVGVVIITLLFIGSIVSFFVFMRMNKREKP